MKSRRRNSPFLCAAIALAADALFEPTAWRTLAYEVELKTRKAALTRQHFEQCVKNFSRYPKVPLVIEHADTRRMAGDEAVPVAWAEPHGYITELRVGTFKRADGTEVASLEGKMAPDEMTAKAIPSKWSWGSVTIFFDCVDEESGAEIGAMLYSFSLTAHPALVEIPSLTAIAAGRWYGDVQSRDDLVEALRQIFELPTLSPESDVLAHLEKLESMLGSDESVTGVDVDDLVCALRSVMRLPALATASEVLAEVRKGLAMPTETNGDAVMNHQENSMRTAMMIAAALALNVKDEMDAREKLVAFAAEAPDVRKALNLAANATFDQVIAAMSKLSSDSAQLSTVVAERDALKKAALARDEADRKAAAERDEADRKTYLDELCASRPELTSVRASLELHLKSDRVSFEQAYPRPSAAELHQRAQDGARLSVAATPARPHTASPTGEPGGNLDASFQAAYDLMNQTGCSFAAALDSLGMQG